MPTNLLFVFADQMRGMDMRCAGNKDVHTPHLDALARRGARFTHAYATTPLCGPNRACLLTGLYPSTTASVINDAALDPRYPTLGTLAKSAGYRTGYIGKWHLDGAPRDKFTPPGPRRLGFDDFWAVHNCRHTYTHALYYRDSPQIIRDDRYEPQVQTDLAIEFLHGAAAREQPFCLVLSFGPPHNPYEECPEPYRRLYKPDQLTLRPNCKPIPREHLDPAWEQRLSTADYYALITSLDDQFGRLMHTLETLGLADDTLVVFTSDHGDMMWSQGLLYKCVPFEESVNVPLILRGPRSLITPGSVNPTLVGTVDLVPTLASLMNLPIHFPTQGRDLAPFITPTPKPGPSGPDLSPPAEVFLSQYTHYVFNPATPCPEWRGLRTQRHTYAETTDRKPWLLFDNHADPYQLDNLAADPAHGRLRAELASRLDQHLRRINDPFLPTKEMIEHHRIGKVPKY